MRERLRQLESAEALQKQASRHPKLAQEEQTNPIDALLARSGLPERAQSWLRQHPEFLIDPRKNSSLQYHHFAVADEHEPYSAEYYQRMETLLGLRPDVSAPPVRSAEPAPQLRRQQSPVGISAPPTRETPSWSSGRRDSETRMTLTAQDRELAAMWNISEQDYLKAKARVAREREQGFHNERG
jgi:hypothetical protein